MKSKSLALVLAACTLLSGCHEHTWTEATCLAPATCIECAEVEDETFSDHVWTEATCGTPKTCSVCALTEGKPVGEHNWKEATCDAPKTCTVCGLTEGQKLRHSSSNATCTEPMICKNCGQTLGEPLGHTWLEATCVAPKTCETCAVTEGEKISEHTWVEATCTTAKTCKHCGLTEGDTLGHDVVDMKCKHCGQTVRPAVHPNAGYAAYFGINPSIKWVENADSRDEIVNNILWNALNGDFSFDWIKNTSYRDSEDVINTIDSTITVYCDLLGGYLNIMRGGRNGPNFWIHYDTEPLPLSEAEVYQQALSALAKAQSISKKLHNNGTITDDMSQTAIMKAYYDYMQGYGNKAGGGPELRNTGKNMFYDTAYSCLIDKQAACGGRAAAFNLLMHVEGISAQGISGQIIGTNSGHIISRVVADSTEYFVDWGNNKPISTYEQALKWFNFNYNDGLTSLELARNAG